MMQNVWVVVFVAVVACLHVSECVSSNNIGIHLSDAVIVVVSCCCCYLVSCLLLFVRYLALGLFCM